MTKPSEERLVIGFDLLPQSSVKVQDKPRFAMALVRGSQVEVHGAVRRAELLRAIRKHVPYAVATDNLMELAPTERGVIDFLAKLPARTKIIQVTGSPVHGMTPLMKLARRHGFPLAGHPNPEDTAVLVARLAALGVGTEVSVLARETRIVISRARTIGPGGFSQSRFQRRMHGAIQQVARNILDRLSRYDMDFDYYTVKTAHGWARCVIHVYEAFDRVSEVVHPEVNRIAGVAVRLAPVKHRSIVYLPTDREMPLRPRRRLVVGIDAGITCGIAVADVNGQLLALHSGRGMSRGEVLRYLMELGTPILVATDVTPAPSFVEKLSKALNVPLFTPPRVLAVVEKRELANAFAATSDMRPTNAHQRDALAAVAKVFQMYEKKIHLLRKRLLDGGDPQVAEEAMVFVLQGLPVHEAIRRAVENQRLKRIEHALPAPATPPREQPSPEELVQAIERLHRQVDSLQRQLDYERLQHQRDLEQQRQLEEELRATQRRLDRVLREENRRLRRDELVRQKEKEIARLHQVIRRLQGRLEEAKRTIANLKLMRRLEIRGEVQPVYLLHRFTQEEVRRAGDKFAMKRGVIVYILDPSGGGSSTADLLIGMGVKAVIIHGTMSHLALSRFIAADIPVVNDDDLRITIVDEFAVVDNAQLENKLAEWRKSRRVIEREAAVEALERMVEEYRQERRREATD